MPWLEIAGRLGSAELFKERFGALCTLLFALFRL